MSGQPAVRFDDGKAPDALRTIGEVARALGLRQHVLRYWEEQFPKLRPLKRSGGRRYYRPEDVALVQAIDQLVHREGYTLRGARQALDEAGIASARRTVPAENMSLSFTGSARATLLAVRNRLASALEHS